MVTFKQFIAEDRAREESVEATPGNVDGAFTVGKVHFDNERGMGSTPNGANVMYRGAVAWIKPSVFRKLAMAAERGKTAASFVELLKNNKSIAVPWLDIDVHGDTSNPEAVKVTGHEGRARADAFRMLNGDIPMPVQLQLVGIRARHLSPEFFAWVDEHGIQAERSSAVVKLDATRYFWDGKEIKAQ